MYYMHVGLLKFLLPCKEFNHSHKNLKERLTYYIGIQINDYLKKREHHKYL